MAQSKQDELYKALQQKGYPDSLCREIAYKQMNTDYTATRMLGYLYRISDPRPEDVVDEMLAILSDRNSIIQKKEWLMNTLEMPLANICGHGDVQVPTRDVVIKCCKKAGLKVEKFEIRKGMRMHCVVRKPMGKAIGNER